MAVADQGPARPDGRRHDHHHHHDHEQVDARLVSVGVDIGSATTHLSLSALDVGKRDARMSGRPEVLRRRLLYQSTVSLTAYQGSDAIDAGAVEGFVRDEIRRAGFHVDDVHTGAVICTGEAARKSNAAAISARVSEISGDFVCATAGHDLEAVLGAHGSGAVEASRHRSDPLVLLDVGGGTAKRSVVSRGQVVDTAAINIGTRLLAFDGSSRVVRAERAGIILAASVGVRVGVGDTLSPVARRDVAERMADLLAEFLGLRPLGELARSLLLTAPPSTSSSSSEVALSGGLAEYVFGRSTTAFGDLGLDLAVALQERVASAVPGGAFLDLGTGIRATVIGAGQYSVQMSGDTIFAAVSMELPIRGVPVRAVAIDWTDVHTESVEHRIRERLLAEDDGQVCALAFPGAPAGYGAVRALGDALGDILPRLPIAGSVLVFERNVARTVGERVSARRPGRPFLCLDEVVVGDLDYLDIGAASPGTDYLPLVVRSLVLADEAPGEGWSPELSRLTP